jgi:hypothetical protein
MLKVSRACDRRICQLGFAKNNQERGGLSEIGGQMNETKEKSTVTILPPEKKDNKTTPVRSGAESLRAEADRVLQIEGKGIAEALAVEAKKGHIQSARFLYELADENCKLGAVEMIRTARSLAMQWTTEPLWVGEADELMAKIEDESREPAS